MIMTHTTTTTQNLTKSYIRGNCYFFVTTCCKDMFSAAVKSKTYNECKREKWRHNETQKFRKNKKGERGLYIKWNLMQVAALISLYQIIKSSDCFIKQPTNLFYRFNTFQRLSDNVEIQICLLSRTKKMIKYWIRTSYCNIFYSFLFNSKKWNILRDSQNNFR